MNTNLKVGGIVAEFNPFHNGHAYLLEEAAKQMDYVIVIMSGNFVQRGEPAIIDKWARTEMCLQHGADLVIELPVYLSTSSAEFFSGGAIKYLNSLNIVTDIFLVQKVFLMNCQKKLYAC